MTNPTSTYGAVDLKTISATQQEATSMMQMLDLNADEMEQVSGGLSVIIRDCSIEVVVF